jgi:predicted DCC family thiol-disulfide oxidoreductase YuxK
MSHGSMQQTNSDARIIVFDGICHVCSGGVRFLAKHRIEPPFQLIPMQSSEGKSLLEQYGIDSEDPATFLVLDRGLVLTQSDASIHIMGAIGGVWRLVAIARLIPRSWRDWLYRLLARNRYRWFGRRATCYLPR